jgi:hypothetical protein
MAGNGPRIIPLEEGWEKEIKEKVSCRTAEPLLVLIAWLSIIAREN